MQKTFANLELNGKAVDITVADGRIVSIVPAAEVGASAYRAIMAFAQAAASAARSSFTFVPPFPLSVLPCPP